MTKGGARYRRDERGNSAAIREEEGNLLARICPIEVVPQVAVILRVTRKKGPPTGVALGRKKGFQNKGVREIGRQPR